QDAYQVSAETALPTGTVTVSNGVLTLSNVTPSPSGPFSNDLLPNTPPLLSNFQNASFFWNERAYVNGAFITSDGFAGSVAHHVTVVPLPGALLLLSSALLGAAGIGARARRATA